MITDKRLEEAQIYCEEIALNHYENFSIASSLLPREKRFDYYSLYAFARGADDIADENNKLESQENKLNKLDGWLEKLNNIYEGLRPDHPVFIALEDIINRYQLPAKPFQDLIRAFKEDQYIDRYEGWEDVLHYTSGSANPVGRLVLRLYGYDNNQMDKYSDNICTALQLANFIQDIKSDYQERGRIYIPLEDLKRFAVEEEELLNCPLNKNVINLIKFEVKRADKLFNDGKPLLKMVKGSLRFQLRLFVGGGRLALDAVKRVQYDISGGRPEVDKGRKFALLLASLFGVTR